MQGLGVCSGPAFTQMYVAWRWMSLLSKTRTPGLQQAELLETPTLHSAGSLRDGYMKNSIFLKDLGRLDETWRSFRRRSNIYRKRPISYPRLLRCYDGQS